MSSKPIMMSPTFRSMLQETEKENIRHTGVILHTRSADKEFWDEESLEIPKARKRSREGYVTKSDTPASRRRQKQKMEESEYGSPTHVEDFARRNERERNRVRLLNESFDELRDRIPSDLYETAEETGKTAKKKLSKVGILRLAVEYIQRLEVLLGHDGDDSSEDDTFLQTGIKIEQDFESESNDAFLASDIKQEKHSESESDAMDLSSDNRSRDDDDHFDGLEVDDSVEKSVGQYYDEASLPPISESFPIKLLPINYSEIYVPYSGAQRLVH